jgi:hypothetical protein
MTAETAERVTDGASRDLRRRGMFVLAFFGLLWAAVAASGLSTGPGWAVRIGAVVVTVAIVVAALRPRRAPERQRTLPAGWRRWVGIVNGGQFAVIAVIVAVGLLAGVPQIVPPLVALVVGLHFFPLARLFDQPQYTSTAVGLCVAAVAGGLVLVLGPSQEVSRLVIGTVAALTLWATAAWLALRG